MPGKREFEIARGLTFGRDERLDAEYDKLSALGGQRLFGASTTGAGMLGSLVPFIPPLLVSELDMVKLGQESRNQMLKASRGHCDLRTRQARYC